MKDLSVHCVNTEDDLKQAFKLREDVFVHEQKVSMEAEFDGLDDQCQHLVASIGLRIVGTLRIRPIDDQLAKIERVAVLKHERGRQVGARLMEAALKQIGDAGPRSVKIHAQTQAKAFYARLGFVASGDIFDEDGIQHIAMYRQVS